MKVHHHNELMGLHGYLSILEKFILASLSLKIFHAHREIRSIAFALRENAKRELSFFLSAARAAGKSPEGSKAVSPPVPTETVLKIHLIIHHHYRINITYYHYRIND
ncbi:MAG: hypothetical protein LBG98_03580 [Puniceicoccales bacterium]|jgi:hypothetical protein|nr:hypothetical protein [Puniceicoccales bacterium]